MLQSMALEIGMKKALDKHPLNKTASCTLSCMLLGTMSLSACGRSPVLTVLGEMDSHEIVSNESQNPYVKPGFYVEEVEGRLWVFHLNSKALTEYKEDGEPAKSTTVIGMGPGGMTIRSDTKETVIEYLASKGGFYSKIIDDRLWILKNGSESLRQLLELGEPAVSTTFVGKGPLRISVRSDSKETYIEYLASKKGFWTEVKDERLWILEKSSESHQSMVEHGDIAKNITLIGKGPLNTSIRSDDKATVLKWAASVDGFHTYMREGRIWVFRPNSEHEAEFLKIGEPAKSITKIGAGPLRATVRAAEEDVMQRYLRACLR